MLSGTRARRERLRASRTACKIRSRVSKAWRPSAGLELPVLPDAHGSVTRELAASPNSAKDRQDHHNHDNDPQPVRHLAPTSPRSFAHPSHLLVCLSPRMSATNRTACRSLPRSGERSASRGTPWGSTACGSTIYGMVSHRCSSGLAPTSASSRTCSATRQSVSPWASTHTRASERQQQRWPRPSD